MKSRPVVIMKQTGRSLELRHPVDHSSWRMISLHLDSFQHILVFCSKCNQYWLLETRKKRKNKLKVAKNAKTSYMPPPHSSILWGRCHVEVMYVSSKTKWTYQTEMYNNDLKCRSSPYKGSLFLMTFKEGNKFVLLTSIFPYDNKLPVAYKL